MGRLSEGRLTDRDEETVADFVSRMLDERFTDRMYRAILTEFIGWVADHWQGDNPNLDALWTGYISRLCAGLLQSAWLEPTRRR